MTYRSRNEHIWPMICIFDLSFYGMNMRERCQSLHLTRHSAAKKYTMSMLHNFLLSYALYVFKM
jgi:hypothetical protein